MAGVVPLVDADCDLVVAYLGYCIYDKAVVLLAIVAGNHIEAVAQAEESCHIVLLRCLW